MTSPRWDVLFEPNHTAEDVMGKGNGLSRGDVRRNARLERLRSVVRPQLGQERTGLPASSTSRVRSTTSIEHPSRPRPPCRWFVSTTSAAEPHPDVLAPPARRPARRCRSRGGAAPSATIARRRVPRGYARTGCWSAGCAPAGPTTEAGPELLTQLVSAAVAASLSAVAPSSGRWVTQALSLAL